MDWKHKNVKQVIKKIILKMISHTHRKTEQTAKPCPNDNFEFEQLTNCTKKQINPKDKTIPGFENRHRVRCWFGENGRILAIPSLNL